MLTNSNHIRSSNNSILSQILVTREQRLRYPLLSTRRSWWITFNTSAKPATFGPPAARHRFKLLTSELTIKDCLHFYPSIAALLQFDNGDVGASLITPFFLGSHAKVRISNITWHASSVSHQERCELRGQKGFTLWFTGLSASGKSTIAIALEQHLLHLGLATYRLDGDNVRFGLNKDLGFSERDRNENIRRIAEVGKLRWRNTVL